MMLSASRARKRQAAREAARVRVRTADPALPVPTQPDVAEPLDEANGFTELFGEFAAVSRGRLRSVWRRLRWGLLAVPLVAVAAPCFLWLQHHSQHVISKNAAVRGHLAEIGTRLGGLVSRVDVNDGDRVKKGQVLVQLEDRHLRAEVREVRAEVAGLEHSIAVERMAIDLAERVAKQNEREASAAVASLERTIAVERVAVGLQRREIEQRKRAAQANSAAAAAETETARIEAEDASRNHKLQESLSSGGGVSSKRVRDAEYAWRTAEAKLKEARANALVATQSVDQGVREMRDALTIREHKIGVLEADLIGAQARLVQAQADSVSVRKRQVAVLEARLEAARARQSRAEADLDSAAIRAPEDGAIVRRIVQPGGSIDVGQPVISMWLGAEVWVEAWIDEEDLGFVRLGNPATVTFHSFAGREFLGTVDNIGLVTDLEIPDTEVPRPRFSRMRGAPVVGVHIRLHEPPPYLLPGLSAVVAIEKTPVSEEADAIDSTASDEAQATSGETAAIEEKE